MTGTWIVIPSQGFERGKSRLAPVLDAAQRRRFSRASFARVLRAARLAAGGRRTVIVSRNAEALGLARRAGAHGVLERRPGLNRSIRQAAQYALRRGARALIVVHADLPELRPTDLRVMARSLLRAGVVIAPDRESSGTNALGLRRGDRVRFRFGADSFRRHAAEAKRARRRLKVIRSPGLARDVDTPQDYAAYAGAAARPAS